MDAILSPRRRVVLQALGAAALLAACGDRRGAGAAPVFAFRGLTMGSAFTLQIAGAHLSGAGRDAARAAANGALDAVDRAMSAFRPDSEVSAFNAHGGDAPFELSSDTYTVFALSQRIAADTGGAFDITVAPIVDAWGFGPMGNHRVATAEEIRTLESFVGYCKLALDDRNRTITKSRPDLRADLSGVAKGFGVDKAARALEALGFERYVVEAGGEVRARGNNAAGEPWQIAIEEPDARPQRPRYVVPLSGASIATSGDYRIYFVRDGRRYCHEIDPATGGPIQNGLASVSVVAADCASADALATALMVLGPERGYAFAAQRNLAAYFIVRTPAGELEDCMTPAFVALGGRRLIAF